MPPSCMNMIVGELEEWKTHGLVMAMCQTNFEGGVLHLTNSVWWCEGKICLVEYRWNREENKERKKEEKTRRKKRRK